MSRFRPLIGVLAIAALVLSAPTVASAHDRPPVDASPKVWSTEVAAPFSLSVVGKRVFVADGGSGTFGMLRPNGSITPLITGVPGLAGHARLGWSLGYTSTVTEEGTYVNTESGLNIRSMRGKTRFVDLHAYEVANNPDSVNHYGVEHPSQCVSDAFGAAGIPASYTGMVDAHAYNVVSSKGSWLVADAGANAILQVSNRGTIRTLAVLPPQPVVITAEMAAAFGMPDCVVGVTYAFEPVPTGIAIGRGGQILVSTLPGGPEMGARGALWRVDPRTGAAKLLASGLAGPTSIASSGSSVYVAELFGGRVSRVTGSTVTKVADLPGALAVATGANGTLWAATMGNDDPATPGSIVSISGKRVKVIGHLGR